MATAGAAGSKFAAARKLDLKWFLTIRVVAVAMASFLAVATFALYGTYRDLRQTNEAAADLVTKQLQVQLFRIDSNIDALGRFPDWDPVIDHIQRAGQCIRYVRPDGGIGRSSCMGVDQQGGLPAWIAALGVWLLGDHAAITRPIAYHGKAYGTLVVTTGTAVVLAAIWRDVSWLLGLTALLVVATCVLQFVAIGRALRPTRQILAGLDRLARGDLSCRLPDAGLVELQRISEVFNTLAANLDRTVRERTALAGRLVDGQEQERRRLARELHDDLAQSLSAISATAASIRTTAVRECPTLVPEAERLARTSMALMRSLRATLQNLRPPEIEDFGLATSLTTLVRERERAAGGRLAITLEVEGDLHELPPTTAAHVYRMVQEGLTNIGKHAAAGRARVALRLHPSPPEQAEFRRRWLDLSIENDGCDAVESAADEGTGLGLVGMRERAMALGGQLDIIRLDHGFRLQAVIPFTAESAP